MKKNTVTFLVIAIMVPLMVVAFVIYLNPQTREVACVSTVYLQFVGLPTSTSSGTYTTTTNTTAPIGHVMTTTLTPVNSGAQLYQIDETCTFVSK